jgi:hypothetical protein
VTGYEAGIQFPAEVEGFSFAYSVKTGSGAHSYSDPMGKVFFLGVKRPELEADYSHPSSAEVNNGGAIPPVPHTSSWRDV